MRIVKEAVIFFAIVLALVAGATYLSRQGVFVPENASAENISGEKSITNITNITEITRITEITNITNTTNITEKEPTIFFRGTFYYNGTQGQFTIPEGNYDVSFIFESPDGPLILNEQELGFMPGDHLISLKNFNGSITLRPKEYTTLQLYGTSKNISINNIYFYSKEWKFRIRTPILKCSFVSVKNAKVYDIHLNLLDGNMNVRGMTAKFNFLEGDTIDLKNFIGDLEVNTSESKIFLEGLSESIRIYSSAEGVSEFVIV